MPCLQLRRCQGWLLSSAVAVAFLEKCLGVMRVESQGVVYTCLLVYMTSGTLNVAVCRVRASGVSGMSTALEGPRASPDVRRRVASLVHTLRLAEGTLKCYSSCNLMGAHGTGEFRCCYADERHMTEQGSEHSLTTQFAVIIPSQQTVQRQLLELGVVRRMVESVAIVRYTMQHRSQ